MPFPEDLATLLEGFLQQTHTPSSLPAEFRAALLRREAEQPELPLSLASEVHRLGFSEGTPTAVQRGVPVHPLFKYLASALWDWMINCRFPRQLDLIPGFPYDPSLEEKIKLWTDKIVKSVDGLQKLMQRAKLSLQVPEKLLPQIEDAECRGDALRISLKYPSVIDRVHELPVNDRILEGDLFLLNKMFLFEFQVEDKHACDFTTSAMVYEAILDYQDPTNGSLIAMNDSKIVAAHAFQIQALPDDKQPIRIIRDIVEVLDIEGIRSLIGFRSTVGSVRNALSPGWATLIGSFVALNTSGSKLTVGGRALAKHVHRSTAGWWGHFSGNDVTKNILALNVITQIMKNACWLNVHFIPPDLHVFEIRVHEGYGARWTADGSKGILYHV